MFIFVCLLIKKYQIREKYTIETTFHKKKSQWDQKRASERSEHKEEPWRHEAYLEPNSDNGSETGSENSETGNRERKTYTEGRSCDEDWY